MSKAIAFLRKKLRAPGQWGTPLNHIVLTRAHAREIVDLYDEQQRIIKSWKPVDRRRAIIHANNHHDEEDQDI